MILLKLQRQAGRCIYDFGGSVISSDTHNWIGHYLFSYLLTCEVHLFVKIYNLFKPETNKGEFSLYFELFKKKVVGNITTQKSQKNHQSFKDGLLLGSNSFYQKCRVQWGLKYFPGFLFPAASPDIPQSHGRMIPHLHQRPSIKDVPSNFSFLTPPTYPCLLFLLNNLIQENSF